MVVEFGVVWFLLQLMCLVFLTNWVDLVSIIMVLFRFWLSFSLIANRI